MSETQSAGRPLLSNYECVHEPRALTDAEVASGHEQDSENDTVAYYAVKREDGYLGADIGANTKTAKIRILYVSENAAWSFTRMHKANEVEGGDSRHAFTGDWPAVIQTDPETGQQTARRSLTDFRELAASLHDDAHELVTDGAGRHSTTEAATTSKRHCSHCGQDWPRLDLTIQEDSGALCCPDCGDALAVQSALSTDHEHVLTIASQSAPNVVHAPGDHPLEPACDGARHRHNSDSSFQPRRRAVIDDAATVFCDNCFSECPRCGITFDDAEHDICEDCQRVQRIVGDKPDDGLDEADSDRGRLEVDN